eukprot:12208643-Heterocapsa_arctica.AAC.1
MEYMDGEEANIFNIEGTTGTFREHPVEVAGTILESILGLGAIFEEHGHAELEELPEIIVELERQRANFRSLRMRKKYWLWEEYDEICGFKEVPLDYPDYQIHA